MSDEKLDEILGLLRGIRDAQSALPKAWLTPEEAANHLGISLRRIYQYASAGSIPCHRLPDSNLLRFHINELDAWVRRSTERSNELSKEILRRLKI